ncbi:MAG: hypothetical protein ACXWXV_11215 [Aeromicrobium sp.]
MHPIRHPRNAALVGAFFVGLAAAYWLAQVLSGVSVDFAGVTILTALGFATGLMAYVLVAGSTRD